MATTPSQGRDVAYFTRSTRSAGQRLGGAGGLPSSIFVPLIGVMKERLPWVDEGHISQMMSQWGSPNHTSSSCRQLSLRDQERHSNCF
jgi:hypothetical protein